MCLIKTSVLLFICLLFTSCAIYAVAEEGGALGTPVVLNTIKMVVVQFNADNSIPYFSESKKATLLAKCREELGKMGFTIINDSKAAELIFSFSAEAQTGMDATSAVKMRVDLSSPQGRGIIWRIEADTKDWKSSGVDSQINYLFEQLRKERDSKETTYYAITPDVENKITAAVDEKPAGDRQAILKKHEMVNVMRDASYPTNGVIVIPIWGEKTILTAVSNPATFVGWFGGPSKDDMFYDVSTLGTKSASDRIYLITDTPGSERLYDASFNKVDYAYYRDDLRDTIVSSIVKAIEPYKMNLKEVSYEEYAKDLLSSGLEKTLAKIKDNNPDLNRIFVVYYVPFSAWSDVEVRGNYTYKYYSKGLKLTVYVSYFDLYKKYNRLMKTKAEYVYKDYNPANIRYASVAYGLYTQWRERFSNKGANDTPEFLSKNTLKTLYVIKRDSHLLDAEKKVIAELKPGAMLINTGMAGDLYQVKLSAYVDSKKTTLTDGNAIDFNEDKVALWGLPSLESRFKDIPYSYADHQGKVASKSRIALTQKPEKVSGSQSYRIEINGLVSADDISDDVNIFKKRGSVHVTLQREGVPLANVDVILLALGGKFETKTNEKGEVTFKNVPPAIMYPLKYRDKTNLWSYGDNDSYAIMINPGENLDMGIVDMKETDLTNVNETLENIKKITSRINKWMSKERVVADYGKPLAKYSSDIWRYRFADKAVVDVCFLNDNVGFVEWRCDSSKKDNE